MLSDKTPAELLVRAVTWVADGVVTLDLVDPELRRLPQWEAGAHIDIVLPSGLVRQYSLCGDLNDHRVYRIGVLRDPNSRGGSIEIHDSALVGRRLTVRGPRNNFKLVDAQSFLFLAGGIGVTPMIPMLQEAERRGTPWRMVYGGRSRATMAFLGEIAKRTDGSYDVVTEEEVGYPDFDTILSGLDDATAVYCCGPTAMIDVVEHKCEQYLKPGALHIERFTAAPVDPDAEPGDNDSFEVELAKTGVTLTVPPDRSLLRTVLDAVPTFLYSCEEGYCGTCEATCLSGEVDHRDTVLTDEEKDEGKIMLCVSRAKSGKLVLDL